VNPNSLMDIGRNGRELLSVLLSDSAFQALLEDAENTIRQSKNPDIPLNSMACLYKELE
jgi:hypothetical protein